MRLSALSALANDRGLLLQRELVPDQLTRKAWRHAHESGLLVSIHVGVSRAVDTAETPELLIAAAVEAARPRTGDDRVLAAGRTAAALAGVEVPAIDPIHVSPKGRPHLGHLDGVAIHRPRNNIDLVRNDANDPIPRTRLVRALLDVAAWDPDLTSPSWSR